MSTSARLPRSWARLSVVAALTSALGAGAVAVLLHEEAAPSPRGPATSPVAQVAPVTTHVEPATRTGHGVVLAPPRRPDPTAVAEVLAAKAPSELAGWVANRTLEPRLRYAALRRLEAEAPADGVTAAIGVLDDTTPLVRLNAIALLTRSKEPAAQAALAGLDDRSRQLAGALARRSR